MNSPLESNKCHEMSILLVIIRVEVADVGLVQGIGV